MIRNIILDIGKVLVSYEPEQMMKTLGFGEEEIKIVNRAMFENPLWEESDKGLMSVEEFHQAFLNQDLEHKDLIQKAYEHIGDTIELMPHALKWILELKNRGYHVYILSNYAEYTLEKTREKLEFLPLMDGIVFSYECKMGKPEEGIYKKLISEYFLEEEESVFIDDRKENIEAAKKLGIHGIQFMNFAQARGELDTYLINNG